MRVKPLPSPAKQPPEDLDRGQPAVRILDLVNDAVVAVDGRSIVLFNRAAAVMFGHLAAEVLGKPLGILLEAGLKETRWRRKDGSEFVPELSRREITWNGRNIAVYILRYITPPTVIEERLRATLREKMC